MRIFIRIVILTVLFFIFSYTYSFAQSPYVLPYPSFMPGSMFYKINQVQESIEQYWYFGNFAQFRYNLQMSDKYLVEAKTLFEYKQYLLGVAALENSNEYFKRTVPYLNAARKEGKDVSEKQAILESASLKHREVLEDIKQEVPEEVYWSPEKVATSRLELHKVIQEAVEVRE